MERPGARTDRILRKPELLEVTGLSSATVYRWMAEGSFPQPVRLGANSIGWRSSEVQEWIASRERVDSNGDGTGKEAWR